MDTKKPSFTTRHPFVSRRHFVFLFGIIVAFLFIVISVLQSNQYRLLPDHFRSDLEEDAPHQDSSTTLDTVRVLCWIMTTPDNHESKAVHVQRTWGRRCDRLLFMSSTEDQKLGTVALPVTEGRQSLWNKTREAFRYVYEHHLDGYDWFMKADDDTYVIVENLKYFLYSYDPKYPIYFGSKFRYPEFVKQGYFSGGAGYVLSKEALKRFVEQALPDAVKCPTDYDTEDLEMGRCMEAVNVTAGDSRDLMGRKRFLPMQPMFHLTSSPTEDPEFWYKDYSFYEPLYGENCCSDLAISFHYIPGLQMYVMDYLIYSLHPYGKRFQNPALLPKKTWEEAMVVEGPYPVQTTTVRSVNASVSENVTLSEESKDPASDSSGSTEISNLESIKSLSENIGGDSDKEEELIKKILSNKEFTRKLIEKAILR